MVALLLELGADPAATDGSGVPAAVYAAAPNVDRQVIETLTRRGTVDVFSALALGDQATAARLLGENRGIIEPGGASAGALHLMAKRGDVQGVKWLLDHGADPSARWNHWGAEVTPLHLAAMQGHADVARRFSHPAPTQNIATRSTTATRSAGPSFSTASCRRDPQTTRRSRNDAQWECE